LSPWIVKIVGRSIRISPGLNYPLAGCRLGCGAGFGVAGATGVGVRFTRFFMPDLLVIVHVVQLKDSAVN
jgi:hypothetical protein